MSRKGNYFLGDKYSLIKHCNKFSVKWYSSVLPQNMNTWMYGVDCEEEKKKRGKKEREGETEEVIIILKRWITHSYLLFPRLRIKFLRICKTSLQSIWSLTVSPNFKFVVPMRNHANLKKWVCLYEVIRNGRFQKHTSNLWRTYSLLNYIP